jgi:hypothetical protein
MMVKKDIAVKYINITISRYIIRWCDGTETQTPAYLYHSSVLSTVTSEMRHLLIYHARPEIM